MFFRMLAEIGVIHCSALSSFGGAQDDNFDWAKEGITPLQISGIRCHLFLRSIRLVGGWRY